MKNKQIYLLSKVEVITSWVHIEAEDPTQAEEIGRNLPDEHWGKPEVDSCDVISHQEIPVSKVPQLKCRIYTVDGFRDTQGRFHKYIIH